MNYTQIDNDINTRLSSSKTYSLMKQFQEAVSLFPANYIDVKKKREKAIYEASEKVYALTTKFKSLVHEFSNSVVLICNENCVPHMIDEVGAFIYNMEAFYKEKDKIVKSIQELNEYYKPICSLKAKTLTDAFLCDMGMYSKEYNFEIDKKMIAMQIKEKYSCCNK